MVGFSGKRKTANVTKSVCKIGKSEITYDVLIASACVSKDQDIFLTDTLIYARLKQT
jgi:hypothetical protein